MSSKMDGYASRTPSDIERRYGFGRSFSEILGVAQDAQTHATVAERAVKSLSLELSKLSVSVKDDKKGLEATLEAKLNTADLVSEFNMKADEITITSEGFKLKANGEIEATSGKLAGWDITDKSICKLTDNFLVMLSVPETDYSPILSVATADNTEIPFYVAANGFLYAKSGYFEGQLEAGSGHIGNWDIESDRIQSITEFTRDGVKYQSVVSLINHDSYYHDTNASRAADVLVIAEWNQSTGAGSFPFALWKDGTLLATKANITGTVNAQGGKFACWTIADDYLIAGASSVANIDSGAQDGIAFNDFYVHYRSANMYFKVLWQQIVQAGNGFLRLRTRVENLERAAGIISEE